MEYGLISANTGNLGDDIQSLAASRFLPRVDHEIDRDVFGGFRSGRRVKVICNAWWAHGSRAWPPRACVDPLFVSMHISEASRGSFEKHKDVFKDRRVGARDTDTLGFLWSLSVDAYPSLCMTLTLPEWKGERRGVVFCDLDPGLAPHLSGDRVTHFVGSKNLPPRTRREMALGFLQRYAGAELVLTTRLHCALPCVALGTPVVLVGRPDSRFGGYEDILNFALPEDLSGVSVGRVPKPDLDGVRESLSEICRDFILDRA